MRDPQQSQQPPAEPKEDPNLVKFDPGTVVAVIFLLLLLPLILTGFISQ